jgi:DNA modification methylase
VSALAPSQAPSGGELRLGDCREVLATIPEGSVHCCVTSPPYWGLRDYGVDGQLGLERSPDEYVARLVDVFRDVRRVLRPDGSLWLNLGDCYATGRGRTSGLKPKDLAGVPWRAAFALQRDGWFLRSEVVWEKPNAMPEPVRDRPTRSHEYLFLLTSSARYYYDADAIREPARCTHPSGNGYRRPERLTFRRGSDGPPRGSSRGWQVQPLRNRRTVWSVCTRPYREAHFATFPPELIEPCVLASCPPGGVVLDPFGGTGTVAEVARRLGRRYMLIELNADYVALAAARLAGSAPREC